MSYAEDMAARLPPGLSLPAEFRALFEWIEANAFFMASNAYPGDQLVIAQVLWGCARRLAPGMRSHFRSTAGLVCESKGG